MFFGEGEDKQQPEFADMAKEGKKLELYEILAAKRAKGKLALGVEAKKTTPEPEPPLSTIVSAAEEKPRAWTAQSKRETPPLSRAETPSDKLVIIDDALDMTEVSDDMASRPQAESRFEQRRQSNAAARETPKQRQSKPPVPVEEPEPKPRSPRFVVIGLDSAFVLFVIVAALVGSSYFLGYKRGQEERPAGLIGLGDIETAAEDSLNLRRLSPGARTTVQPPEQDFTLVLRTEPASEELPERLEYELAEALARGRQALGSDIQGFIFRNTKGNDSRFVLAAGLGKTLNDPELNRLLEIYNQMDGLSFSREPRPYIGCQIAPIRELGVLAE